MLLLDNASLPEPVATLHAALSLRCLTRLSLGGFNFPNHDEQSSLESSNCLDGSEEPDEESSDESVTIRASWAGDEVLQRVSDVPGHMYLFDHATTSMNKQLDIGPSTAKLTMLTLRWSNVRPRTLSAIYSLIIHV